MAKVKGGRASDGVLALRLFDQVFGSTWAAWRAWLCGVFALPMSAAEMELFRRCTNRANRPTARAREVWNVVARRAGKSRIAGFLVAFLAGVKRWTLAPGERGIVQVITPSRRQATVILDYAEAFVKVLPGVEIVRRTLDTIELSTAIAIQVQTASFRTPRGFTVVACICDEIAFWRSDDGAANPDTEILRAVRPSLASVPGSLLIALSSPYAQRGELFRIYERHFGRDGSDVLVWQSDTRTMNPTIPQALIDQAMEDDPASASAEWGGVFRADLEGLFAREALGAVIARGRFELAPTPGISYVGFVDPSGGSADSMTLAIAHRNPAGVPVLDLVRERKPPFSPESVVAEFTRELKRYGVASVFGDRYGGEWPVEQFRKQGIAYEVYKPNQDAGAMLQLTRSEIYLELLPLVNSGTVELLDHPRLIGQLAGLERRAGRTGKDSVDHRPGSHDDVANAAAGALVHAVRSMALATLPSTFCRCHRAISIEGFSAARCFVLGGPVIPPRDDCCKSCPGRLYVEAARDGHEERTGEHLDLRDFVRTWIDLEAHPFSAKVRHAAWMSRDHGL